MWIEQKFSRTNRQPSEVLHFFHSNQLEQKLLFHLHIISISTARETARTYTKFLHYHDLPRRLQVFRQHGKTFLLTWKIFGLSNQKFWLNGNHLRPCFVIDTYRAVSDDKISMAWIFLLSRITKFVPSLILLRVRMVIGSLQRLKFWWVKTIFSLFILFGVPPVRNRHIW